MLNNIAIAIAPSARSIRWVNCRLSWATFSTSLSYPAVTDETLEEYFAMTRDEAGLVKDVGGYVGGFLRDGCRKKGHVEYRQLVTLDLDFAPVNFWEAYTGTRYEAVIHSTHSHTHSKPRYRLIIPLDREILPDEYERVSMVIAGRLGRSYFDDTTFEPNRLMYYPSVARDGEYVFKHIQGEVLSADKALQVELQTPVVASRGPVQADPRGKQGCVGVFCRAYTVYDAIEQLLPGVFEPTNDPDRYTYVGSTTSKGLVIYDGGLFCYSHHSTDPAQGRGLNAFDFVRLHKFAHLDDGSQASGTGLPSYVAMTSYASSLPGFKKQAFHEIQSEFDAAESAHRDTDSGGTNQVAPDWTDKLTYDKKGNIEPSPHNLNLIFKCDPALSKCLAYNEMSERKVIRVGCPWGFFNDAELSQGYRTLDDADDTSGAISYIWSKYGVKSRMEVRDLFRLAFCKNKFHPVRDYLRSLIWDGTDRLHNVLQQVFGADDNAYTREALAKMFIGAVARVFTPGVKFDTAMVFVGDQNAGKSTFINTIARGWCSDSLTDLSSKDALEQLRGKWIIELCEMTSVRKVDVNITKHFISKTEDSFRKAYGSDVKDYRRQCVFFGTTNERKFLRDETGNRRFLPIEVHKERATMYSDSPEFLSIVDQLWAEAVHRFDSGESLKISAEAGGIANAEREEFYEEDGRTSIVREALETPLPPGWDNLGMYERRQYLLGYQDYGEETDGWHPRTEISGLEIWCEILGKDRADYTSATGRQMNKLLQEIKNGWERHPVAVRQKWYGRQTVYRRERSGS